MIDPKTGDLMSTARQKQLAALAPPWKPGQSANPGGKPKGSRNRLQGDFMRRLAEDFSRFGIYAIARMRHDDPSAYVRAVASLMPKELEITRPMDDLTDEQLDAAIATAHAILAAQSEHHGASAGGEAIEEPASELPAVRETS